MNEKGDATMGLLIALGIVVLLLAVMVIVFAFAFWAIRDFKKQQIKLKAATTELNEALAELEKKTEEFREVVDKLD